MATEHFAPSDSQWRMVFRRFTRHRMAVGCLFVLIAVFVASLFAPHLAPCPRDAIQMTYATRPPLSAGPSESCPRFWLGSDNFGRDYLTRLLYAARVSLTIALTVSTISTLIGITFGLLAGYFLGWVDIIISRFLEFISTFPLLVILLILMAILLQNEALIPIPPMLVNLVAFVTDIPTREGKKVTLVVIALALLNWTPTARLMRGMVLSVREQPYIEAARALGASHLRIILRHVFPNAFPPMIVDYTLQLNGVLVLESALSYLGYGVQDPTPTWGNMLAFTQSYMFEHPWMPLIPGIPILLTSLAINYVGDGLRDALDPRLKL